jgi:hypothetical protein
VQNKGEKAVRYREQSNDRGLHTVRKRKLFRVREMRLDRVRERKL